MSPDQMINPRINKVLVTLNDVPCPNKQLRHFLSGALPCESYYILQDIPKQAKLTLPLILQSVVLARAILIDGTPIEKRYKVNDEPEQIYRALNSDLLIQFGIAVALGKEIQCITVGDSRPSHFNIPILKGFHQSYRHRLELEEKLAKRFDLQSDLAQQKKTQEQRLTVSLHDKSRTVSIFGSDPNIEPEIEHVLEAGEWEPNFVTQYKDIRPSRDLSRQITESAFCIFCLSDRLENTQTLVALGIAIGLGIPFVIIHRAVFTPPTILSSFHAIVAYEQIEKADTFLSPSLAHILKTPPVRNGLYRTLIAEQHITQDADLHDMKRVELLLKALADLLVDPIPDPFVGLGNLCILRFYKLGQDAVEFDQAKQYYQQGLEIDKNSIECQNGLYAVDKHKTLSDLVQSENFRAVATLVDEIDEKSYHPLYPLMDDVIVDVADKLTQRGEYKEAIKLTTHVLNTSKSGQILKRASQVSTHIPNEAYIQTYREYRAEIYRLEAQWNKQREILENELSSAKQQLDVIQAHTKEKEQEINSLKNQIKRETQTYKTRIAEMQMELSSIRNQVEQSRKLNRQIANQEGKIHSLKSQLHRDKREHEQNVTQLRTELSYAKSQLKATRINAQNTYRKDSKIRSLESQIQRNKTRIEQMQKNINEKSRKIRKLQNQIKRMQTVIKTLLLLAFILCWPALVGIVSSWQWALVSIMFVLLLIVSYMLISQLYPKQTAEFWENINETFWQ